MGRQLLAAGAEREGTTPLPCPPGRWSRAVAPAPHLRYVRGVEMAWEDIEEAISSLGLPWIYEPHEPNDARLHLRTVQFEIHHSGGHTLVQGTHGWRESSLDAAFLRLRNLVRARAILRRITQPIRASDPESA